MPLGCESETNTVTKQRCRLVSASDAESDFESDTDDIYPSLQEPVQNPSQNNNAKRSRVRSGSLSRPNSRNRFHQRSTAAHDGRDRALFSKIIRTDESKDTELDEEILSNPVLRRVRRSRSRDNFLLGTGRLTSFCWRKCIMLRSGGGVLNLELGTDVRPKVSTTTL